MVNRVADRLEEYWDWFAVALFVLITVDMITTMQVAWHLGPAEEANPFMRWALNQGLLLVTAVNLVATVLAVGIFHLLMESLKVVDPPLDRYASIGIEVWLGLLIAVGLFVFANNLFVIFHGRSLVVFG